MAALEASAARPGSSSATATSRPMSSAPAASPPAKACRRSPMTSAAGSAISARILPMSDDRVRTRLRTAEGWLDFQDYFVRRRAEPVVREIAYAGAAGGAGANPDFLAALADGDLEAVVICPSNPFLSIDPILACRCPRGTARLPCAGHRGVADHRRQSRQGPTAKIMAELGLPVAPRAVARHYADILDIYIADEADAR